MRVNQLSCPEVKSVKPKQDLHPLGNLALLLALKYFLLFKYFSLVGGILLPKYFSRGSFLQDEETN